MAVNQLASALIQVTGLTGPAQIEERVQNISWPNIPLVETDSVDGFHITKTTLDTIDKHVVTFDVPGDVIGMAGLVGAPGTLITMLLTTRTPQSAATADAPAGTRQLFYGGIGILVQSNWQSGFSGGDANPPTTHRFIIDTHFRNLERQVLGSNSGTPPSAGGVWNVLQEGVYDKVSINNADLERGAFRGGTIPADDTDNNENTLVATRLMNAEITGPQVSMLTGVTAGGNKWETKLS